MSDEALRDLLRRASVALQEEGHGPDSGSRCELCRLVAEIEQALPKESS